MWMHSNHTTYTKTESLIIIISSHDIMCSRSNWAQPHSVAVAVWDISLLLLLSSYVRKYVRVLSKTHLCSIAVRFQLSLLCNPHVLGTVLCSPSSSPSFICGAAFCCCSRRRRRLNHHHHHQQAWCGGEVASTKRNCSYSIYIGLHRLRSDAARKHVRVLLNPRPRRWRRRWRWRRDDAHGEKLSWDICDMILWAKM